MSELRQIPSYDRTWLERIHLDIEKVDPGDNDIFSNFHFLKAGIETVKFARLFEKQHHLLQYNPDASYNSQAVIKHAGGNILKLVDPFVVVQLDYTVDEEVATFQIPVQLYGNIDITYLCSEIAYTNQGEENDWYFGPHVIGEISFPAKVPNADIIQTNKFYSVAVPFPHVVVSPQQPRGTFN